MLSFSSMNSLGCTTGQSLFSLHADLTQKVSAVLGEVQCIWEERPCICKYCCLEIFPDFRFIWGLLNFQNKLLWFSMHNLRTLQADRISYSLHSLKCLRLLSLLISIRGKPRLIIGNTVLLIMSMSTASKCSGGRFSSHLHWCKSRVIELFQIQSRRTALIGFSVSIRILLNSASDSVLTLFSFDFMLIYSI